MARDSARLRQTRTGALATPAFMVPVLIALVLIAVVVRQLFVHPPSTTVFGVCAVAAVLDAALAWSVLRSGAATFVVTPSDITFTPQKVTRNKRPVPQVIRRTDGSTLSFLPQDHGIIGDHAQSTLKLRDDATGEEVAATIFGRHKVQRACESQGWPFS